MKSLLVFACVFSAGFAAFGSEQDDFIRVQSEMKDPATVKKLATTPEAKSQTEAIKNMAGSEENERAIYELVSDVFGNMKGMSPEEMQKLLQEASKNPEEFAKKLPDSQKKKLREIAGKIEESRKKKP